VPEIVDHGQSGLLVAPGDLDALAAAVRALLDDPSRRDAMGEAGRARAGRRFAPDVHARAIEQVYDSLLAGR
jgi:glycosyltransferase involved in cell wall biosynthesis